MNQSSILFLIVTLLFCSCQSSINLEEDKDLTAIFSKNEIKEIEKMIGYVDQMVLSRSETKNVNSAYHQFFDECLKLKKDSKELPIPFNEEEKYRFLESLDTNTVNAFWTINDHIRLMHYNDSTYRNLQGIKHLNLNLTGRYMNYLDILAASDDFYNKTSKAIHVSGTISPSVFANFLHVQNTLDFTIPKNRIFATVYILQLDDDFRVKMERYLKQESRTSKYQ